MAEESVETGVCKRVEWTCSKMCAVGDLTTRVDVGSHRPGLAVLSCHVAAMQKAQGGPANVHRHGGIAYPISFMKPSLSAAPCGMRMTTVGRDMT